MTTVKFFADYESAFSFMLRKNKAAKKAGSRDIFALCLGTDYNYAVCDLGTAIELRHNGGSGYIFSFSGYVSNPWAKEQIKEAEQFNQSQKIRL